MRAKELAFLRTLPSERNFDKVKVTQKRVQCVQKSLLFCVNGQVTGKFYDTPTS